MIKKAKISLIGGGNIGGTMAHLISKAKIGDVVLYDINGNMTKGKALDIMQMNALNGIDTLVTGSGDIADIEGSDAIIITAGVPRRPGGTREELISINAAIVQKIATDVKKYAPKAFVIVVTNPLDAMVYLFQRESKMPGNMVVGMAGMLDTARFKLFLAQEFGVSSGDVGAIVLGGHGDSMVPVVDATTISGIKVLDLIDMGMSSRDKLKAIIERTKFGGGEIVSLLGVGSAFYAPAQSCLQMVEQYLLDGKKMLTASALLNGQYGVNNLYVGVPIMLGAGGVERIIELKLSKEERNGFDNSVDIIRRTVDAAMALIAK